MQTLCKALGNLLSSSGMCFAFVLPEAKHRGGKKKEITDIATKTFISTAGKRFTSCPTEAKASTFPVLSFSVAY